jgi:ribose transport system substrate-binding protein
MIRRSGFAAVAVTGLLLGIAACGSSSSSSAKSGATGSASSGGASTAACTQAANAAVAKSEQPQQINYPPAINVKPLAGKTVWMIPDSLSNPLDVQVVDGFKAAAAVVGLKAKVYDGGGTVSGYNEALAQALGAHPAGIIIHAIDPSHVTTELAKARAAGIPVVAGADPASPDVAGYTNTDYQAAGTWEGDYALAKTNCNLDTAIITANIFANIATEATAAQTEIHRLCPSCKVQVVNIDPTTMATALGTQTRSLMTADPHLNFFIAGFDAAAQFMVPAINQAHSKVTLVSNTGNPTNLIYVKDGDVQTGDFSFYPNPAEGWFDLDQLLRAMLHQPAAPAWEQLIPQLIDQSDFASASTSPGWADYQSKFRAIWRTG